MVKRFSCCSAVSGQMSEWERNVISVSNFGRGMIVGARQGGLIRSETAEGFSHTTVS